MGKKRACQDVKVPRPLNEAEAHLYGWVEEAVLTQPSVVESDSIPEFHRNFLLTEDSMMEGYYVLEAAGPSDRVPFRAREGETHFLWVYKELFTRLGVRLPFSDFQRDVMTRCRVAVGQLHLNGWGFILTFEKVCLHYGFRPTVRLFFYIYDILIPPSGKGRSFWLDHEDKPFPWVYWNPEVKGFTVFNLETFEMAAFKFLVSLPGDDLLDVKMKKSKLDHQMAMMANPSRMGPRAILPTGRPSATTATAAAAASIVASPTPGESSSQVPLALTAPEPQKSKKQTSKREHAKVIDLVGEEGLKEDTAADLQPKRRKKKAKEDDAFERALGDDSAGEHVLDPVKVAFPEGFNFRKALNAGLTFAPMREALVKMPLEQLLGESYHLSAKSLACIQVGLETSLAAKVKAEKELSAALDQIEILKVERDSTMTFLPLKEKVDNLDDQLSERTAEFRSALEQITQLEEDNGGIECPADLSKATEASEYWRSKWQKLGTEATEMCQETLDICLDQVSHLCPGVDFSAITLKSRWDPKGRRVFVPQESDVEEEPPRAKEVVPEQHLESTTQASQPVAGDVAGASGECPT
ncbi:hypothetical protein PIB30_042019 [Stylosanthes scabra]|uniref:Transposase (putative) gypsy type domain-containing protein n=1 Tax=Stylosanthes scabra TaxID=79078 RepID=A0ABU6TH69_9FABA|nr:hypothetical protein [Stylosanthes scabra]